MLSTTVAAAILLACAMCPDDTASDPPFTPVVAVHDDDTARGERACISVAVIVGTRQCAVLPALVGADPSRLIVSIYSDDLDRAENAAIELNAAWQGNAITTVRPVELAPPAPYAPLPSGKFYAVS